MLILMPNRIGPVTEREESVRKGVGLNIISVNHQRLKDGTIMHFRDGGEGRRGSDKLSN